MLINDSEQCKESLYNHNIKSQQQYIFHGMYSKIGITEWRFLHYHMPVDVFGRQTSSSLSSIKSSLVACLTLLSFCLK